MTTQLLDRPATATVPGQLDHPTTNQGADVTTAAVPYRIGTPDAASRYPVIVGEDWVIGQAHRWHRDWWTDSSAGEHNLRRPPKGTPGIDMAAAYLAEEYAAGRITAVPLDLVRAEAPKPVCGPVPLLHPRMPVTDRNIKSALTAFAGLAAHHWRAVLTGFPGSDNHWYLSCLLCGWEGPKFWSHLRGRNGAPPSAHRHEGGCVGEEKVRELITAYQQ
ncbi:hypothetical protein C9F11_20985 [Streptomyces sp. YIM 121038]|uniref:hypothetical protein n=1 Tax=Streptomyces sp. YIM 121038 TaxID=2136401 RepID=UPI00111083A4|nr:hypothetical protein [Streptomyces sp. YIM 121038]QCX77829.1 hypothetical protein C9F11_20985 [Streptomyces sp. YIM 121038]